MKDFDVSLDYDKIEQQDIVENDFVWMWINHGVHYIVYKPGCVMTLEAAKKIVEDRIKMVGNISYPGFGDARNLKSITREAMKFNKTPESALFVSAGALFINNQLLKIFSNIFLSLGKTLVPAKTFTDRDKALEWLEQFKEDHK